MYVNIYIIYIYVCVGVVLYQKVCMLLSLCSTSISIFFSNCLFLSFLCTSNFSLFVSIGNTLNSHDNTLVFISHTSFVEIILVKIDGSCASSRKCLI